MTKNRNVPAGVVTSIDDLAAALGYNRRSIMEWKSKEGFPIRPDGNYEILAVHNWKQGYWNSDEITEADLMDMENRTHTLVDSLRVMQSELVQGLPESDQDAFAVRLRETIGKAIQDAFTGPLEYSYYNESYLRAHESEST